MAAIIVHRISTFARSDASQTCQHSKSRCGLVSKNFTEIKKGAEEMVQICDASQWQSNPDPVYGHHRTELRRQASRLVKTAEDQNLDGCAFNYVQTISTCISCHEHCRDVLRLAEIPRQDNMVIPIPTSNRNSIGDELLRYDASPRIPLQWIHSEV